MRVPISRPECLTDVVTLSYVLNRHSPRWGGFESSPRRELQRELVRSSGGPISASLRRLVAQNWLEVDCKHQLLSAHRYRPGSRFSSGWADLAEWEEFSLSIWSRESVFAPVVDSALMAHGSLNFSGVLVLGIFVFRPTEVIDFPKLREFLGFAVSAGTIYECLSRLTGHGLVERVARGRYRLNSSWREVVSESDFATKERERARLIDIRTRRETENFKRIFSRGGLTPELRAKVLADNHCAFCGSRRQMEAHEFPPDAWRPPDMEPIWYALCRKCNARESRFYQTHPLSSYDWLGELYIESDLSRQTRRALLERYAPAFNEAIELKDHRKAQSIAARVMLVMRLDSNPRTPGA
jgi:hypothetical protein